MFLLFSFFCLLICLGERKKRKNGEKIKTIQKYLDLLSRREIGILPSVFVEHKEKTHFRRYL